MNKITTDHGVFEFSTDEELLSIPFVAEFKEKIGDKGFSYINKKDQSQSSIYAGYTGTITSSFEGFGYRSWFGDRAKVLVALYDGGALIKPIGIVDDPYKTKIKIALRKLAKYKLTPRSRDYSLHSVYALCDRSAAHKWDHMQDIKGLTI